MERRSFLTCGVVFTISPFATLNNINSASSLDVKEDVLWSLLGRFAFSVGASVVSSLIHDYIKSEWIDDDLKSTISYANRKLYSDGFTDFSKSKVCRSLSGELLYAAVDNSSTPNICVPVINPRANASVPVTMLEGPSIAALAVAAEHSASKSKASNYLMPIREISSAIGSWQNGYSRPTVYVSQAGNVKIDYRSKGNGYGVARVGVTRASEVLFQKEVDISYEV